MIMYSHPGQLLQNDFLLPRGLSAYRLANDIGVLVNRITAILKQQRRITPETSILLGRYFDLPDDLWLNLQASYDIQVARDLLILE